MDGGVVVIPHVEDCDGLTSRGAVDSLWGKTSRTHKGRPQTHKTGSTRALRRGGQGRAARAAPRACPWLPLARAASRQRPATWALGEVVVRFRPSCLFHGAGRCSSCRSGCRTRPPREHGSHHNRWYLSLLVPVSHSSFSLSLLSRSLSPVETIAVCVGVSCVFLPLFAFLSLDHEPSSILSTLCRSATQRGK